MAICAMQRLFLRLFCLSDEIPEPVMYSQDTITCLALGQHTHRKDHPYCFVQCDLTSVVIGRALDFLESESGE